MEEQILIFSYALHAHFGSDLLFTVWAWTPRCMGEGFYNSPLSWVAHGVPKVGDTHMLGSNAFHLRHLNAYEKSSLEYLARKY